MKHIWNFLTGLFLCLIFLAACGPAPVHADSYPGLEQVQTAEVSYNLYGIVQLILATFGGVATTILLTFLKVRFPRWFSTLKIPDAVTESSTDKPG